MPTAESRELIEMYAPTSMAAQEPTWPAADIRALAERLAPNCVAAAAAGRVGKAAPHLTTRPT